MDIRQQKGLEIAARLKIVKDGEVWIVPSQTGKGKYRVDMRGPVPRCTCQDYELRQARCKHIYAVEYSIERDTAPEGQSLTIEETITETVTKTVKVTYPQNWPAYNAAQTNEKDHFQELLFDLCRGIEEPPQKETGRHRLPLRDMLFSIAFKVYSTFSGRRFICDLKSAWEKGFISKVPHFNSIFNYLEMETLTPMLLSLIVQSSLPLAAIETTFAPDSSGFSTVGKVSWYNSRYGHEQSNQDWLKVHIVTGVKTNIITAVEITGRHDHDSPQFTPMITATAENFDVQEVTADKAYLSGKNMELVASFGGVAFIPFKSNATGETSGSALFEKMYHYFCYRREEFLAHYHIRSNVESTFSMMKAKFGGSIRSKTETAQINEVLCKVLCHNICVVIQSIYELGIEPTFWATE